MVDMNKNNIFGLFTTQYFTNSNYAPWPIQKMEISPVPVGFEYSKAKAICR